MEMLWTLAFYAGRHSLPPTGAEFGGPAALGSTSSCSLDFSNPSFLAEKEGSSAESSKHLVSTTQDSASVREAGLGIGNDLAPASSSFVEITNHMDILPEAASDPTGLVCLFPRAVFTWYQNWVA